MSYSTMWCSSLALATLLFSAAAPGWAGDNDYPTPARADYFIGCMAANSFKHELLEQCACGIDTIADRMTYDDYEKAETVLSMQQGGLGERGNLFRDTPVAKDVVEKLRRAQAEVNLQCK